MMFFKSLEIHVFMNHICRLYVPNNSPLYDFKCKKIISSVDFINIKYNLTLKKYNVCISITFQKVLFL